MNEASAPDAFARSINHFIASNLDQFVVHLTKLSSSFDHSEVELIQNAVEEALHFAAKVKLNRVLLLELHAAQRAGELPASASADRFAQFIELTLQPKFSAHLDRRYPTLHRRLHRSLSQQRRAIEVLLERFITDRAILTHLLGHPAGQLKAITLSQGDLHAGGQSVARLSLDGGDVMYKPRSLRIDGALETFLAQIFRDSTERIRVPKTIDRGDYGWAAFVAHRYCASDEELRCFYRSLGHWLAILRLLGGTDIHLENLVAAGPVPVVVDVESLFAIILNSPPSVYGHAYDLAQTMIYGSVLRTGIVPFRAPMLGYSGVDLSAAGALPGQQPQIRMPVVVNEGTTEACLKLVSIDVDVAQNHPSPNPDLSLYWGQLSDGFLATTERLRGLDADGELVHLLAKFEGCQIRNIRRVTQTYAEIGNMLWHPASLHNEARAIERATDLLARNAAVISIAPSTSDEIAAEIDDLLHGDVPFFVEPVNRARIDATISNWRTMRIELEELIIRCAVAATQLNRGTDEHRKSDGLLSPALIPHFNRLDERRRNYAAEAVNRMLQLAIQGSDGSAIWISPETSDGGWSVQPLQADLYSGLAGIVVALAGYRYEVSFGRAKAVQGLDEILDGALQTLRALETADKPDKVGGFTGYGARIWTWLVLHDVLKCPGLIERAIIWAESLEQVGFGNDRHLDIIDGASGVIVPLVGLAEATGNARWLDLAANAARHLAAKAVVDASGARWPTVSFADPIGGFAHGATGIGWSLARLVLAGGGDEAERTHWSQLADGAFAFQDTLYDEALGNWRDIRPSSHEDSFYAWCNGSVGIGMVAADLYERTGHSRYLRSMRRAVLASRGAWGASATLCHGDLSLWELLVRAAALDSDGCAVKLNEPVAHVIACVEKQSGVAGYRTLTTVIPGLMTGLAGVIHSLNRMHPHCNLASPLLLERRTQSSVKATESASAAVLEK